jgi:uncharacterized protein (TIGR02266 family)
VNATEERRKAALGAAREARALLADLVERADSRLAAVISPIVGALFKAEVGDAPKVLAALDAAMERLRPLADAPLTQPQITRTLSRSMALLYPVRTELARALGMGVRDEITAPFLLDSTRIKPSSPPTDDDRREDLRLEIEVDVGIEGDHTFFTGRMGDLSRGGLFVATDDPLPVETELLLSFLLPDGYRVTAEAVVAWIRIPRYRPDELPSGMGIKFVELSEKDAHAIGHFLKLRPAFHYGD